MRTLLALALLLPIYTDAAESVTVGRLFFTPEQRAQLDTLRIKKVVPTQTKDEPAPEVVTYNGIVRRSDGKATVWVNNKALTEGELSTAESVSGRISRDGQILLGSPASGAGKMQLKVGQSVELLSGRVAEPYVSSKETIAAPKTITAPIRLMDKKTAGTPETESLQPERRSASQESSLARDRPTTPNNASQR